MAEDDSYFETLGILIVIVACFAAGVYLPGTAGIVLLAIGVLVLGLWIVRYMMEGAAEAYNEE